LDEPGDFTANPDNFCIEIVREAIGRLRDDED
jgi:hypothetical protein